MCCVGGREQQGRSGIYRGERGKPPGLVVGPASPTLGQPACYLPLYKSHSFLAALGLQHNTKSALEVEIPVQNFIVEFPLVEVVLEKERVWERLSVKVVQKF